MTKGKARSGCTQVPLSRPEMVLGADVRSQFRQRVFWVVRGFEPAKQIHRQIVLLMG